jgi:hypothetical protein
VPRHLLIEGGEQAGLLMGLAALLAGLVSSLAAGLGPGAATVAGSALEGGVPDGAGGTSPRSPATGAGGLEWDGLLEAVRRQRIEWLASGGQLPEAVAGSSPLGPWSRDGYRTMRGAVEAVHRAVQELRSPGDIHDPSRMKQDEMEDVHRFETMRRATFAGRVVRATVAGGGDVAPDPAPGLRGAVTGALHAFWDAAFPDPTSLAESMVDPQNEYRDLVDAWRKSQTLSRWIRTFTPREPSGIPALIQNLLDERMAEQKAHTGDEEYFDTEYPKWQAELDALKAMEAWSKRGGGAP